MRKTHIIIITLLILLTQLCACTQTPAVTEPTPMMTAGTTPSSGNVSTDNPSTPGATQTPVTPFNVVISELMPENKNLCLGHCYDWIELHNLEETQVSLEGYYLSDNVNNANALSLENIVIPADGYAVITLDDRAPFHLSEKGETVYLMYKGKQASSLEFSSVTDCKSVGPEGLCEFATPGYPNDEQGYVDYLNSVTLPELIINEVLSSNSSYMPVKKKYYDLVEVKNTTDHDVNLSEYTLSDKRSEPAKYTFPDVTLQPGEFYVVYCSSKTSLGKDHADFNISSSGERLYLSKNGTLTDTIEVPSDLKYNESYGRDGHVPVYLSNVTIGSENTGGFLRGVAAPVADIAPGVYRNNVTVTLSGPGKIYYTLDGSRPTEKSSVYTKPITVSGITTIRAFSQEDGRTSLYESFTYVVGESHTLPIVSVSIPQEYLTGDEGVLNHIDEKYEYEAVITLIENGKEAFSEACGFKLHGNDSRKGDKQNFKLIFRSEYGMSKLKYPVFDDRDIDEYNALMLKGGSEDWNRSMMRDEVATDTVDGTTHLYTQAIKPVVLYLGGEYWGVYYLRERYDETYVATHLDVSEESVDLVYSTGLRAESGSNKDFVALLEYVGENDMSTKENFDYLCERIDLTSLIDWYVCRSYMGDKDCANVRRFRSSETDGKWYWMYYDLDWGLHSRQDNPLSSILKGSGDYRLMLAVLKSEEGRDAFLKRYAYLMKTILNPDYMIGVIDDLVATIETEMVRDRERWSKSFSKWQEYVESLRTYVRDYARTIHVLNHLQTYFELSDDEMDYYFNGVME